MPKVIAWFGKIVATSIVSTILGTIVAKYSSTHVSWGHAFLKFWGWILDVITFGIPVWIIAIILIVYISFRKLAKNISSQSYPPYLLYCQDTIEDVLWTWDWKRGLDGKWTIESSTFTAHCPTPNCRGLLVDPYRMSMYYTHTIFCENCGYKKECVPTLDELKNRVIREIYRRVWTGQWKTEQEKATV